MSKYQIIEINLGELGIEQSILRTNVDGTVTSIPNDPANSDYQTYLRWVENPNAPEFQTPWVEPQLTK